MSDGALTSLLEVATVRRVPCGTTLFMQDEPADRFYLLLEGWVKLYRLSEDGTEVIVTIIVAGETFAEAAMFASARFPVSAETVGDVRLLCLSKTALERQVAANPGIAWAMLGSLSGRLRHLVEKIEHLQARSAPQRLGAFLLHLCPPGAPSAEFVLPLPKALIAQRIGIRPETFSRALLKLIAVGVKERQGAVRIADVARLAAYCEDDRPPGHC